MQSIYLSYRQAKKIDEICNELLNKKQHNKSQSHKFFLFKFLSLNLYKNELKNNSQSSIKKKAKFDNIFNNNISRRSTNGKAFIEIYFIDNSNQLKLFGKCEVTNIIDNNKTQTSQIEIDAKELQFLDTGHASVLYFRLIFIKDIEIEFTNTFKMPSIDSLENTVYYLNMFEMTNENNNSKLFELIDENTSPTKLFNSLPILTFQIEIETNSENSCNNNIKSNIKSKYNNRSGKTTLNTPSYLSPLTSPTSAKKKSKLLKIEHSLEHFQNSEFELYYQFIGKNNIKIMTKFDRHELFVCPFCYFNCKILDSLLKHLNCNHFRFQIECIVSIFLITNFKKTVSRKIIVYNFL